MALEPKAGLFIVRLRGGGGGSRGDEEEGKKEEQNSEALRFLHLRGESRFERRAKEGRERREKGELAEVNSNVL